MTHDTPPKEIQIILKQDITFEFNGWYRRDLEKPNWHYYESVDGTMYHCRKENMIAVIEQEIKPEQEAA